MERKIRSAREQKSGDNMKDYLGPNSSLDTKEHKNSIKKIHTRNLTKFMDWISLRY